MLNRYTVPSALLILLSCSVSAAGLSLDDLEGKPGLSDSLSTSYTQQTTPQQHQFNGSDCDGIARQAFVDKGLNSGQRTTDCHVIDYGTSKAESYFHSSPDGSYSTGFTWTFE
ncbi:hypothetical protein VIOR3934_05074 [Vibrio orientalis CIP 102891 = ATCC 33934]|uniref:Outer membrane protein n=1 Tax=Vibrio orientalis CIP 102891 = ATCC 33934 TaxID=675816 RepID=C9QFD8_VIBOR|nr:hypothetical protein [Vibrio orientalis]EEX94906.1 hypothetical protein VIA_002068 [Vibrio orientalis CIP 102891 = ATCC 33934]EGU52962.1 hypothetical protein VIOR3934_05074 [Vibrio orientalis CIP 102891 = ATCC 33934]